MFWKINHCIKDTQYIHWDDIVPWIELQFNAIPLDPIRFTEIGSGILLYQLMNGKQGQSDKTQISYHHNLYAPHMEDNISHSTVADYVPCVELNNLSQSCLATIHVSFEVEVRGCVLYSWQFTFLRPSSVEAAVCLCIIVCTLQQCFCDIINTTYRKR